MSNVSDDARKNGEKSGNGRVGHWFRVADEPRDWEKFYHNRWSYDKSVRTSHSVNCSGSCSWEVFVKDGLITWELQKTDWPQIRSDTPSYEPRGCQRGISSSWYPYSPVRPKFPYVRGVLLDYYRAERQSGKGPVEAYAAIVEDPERKATYRNARGKAGWSRVDWGEVTELIAASIIYTIKTFGADHLASFSPIPAMSIVSFISGQRLSNLLGGTMLSFYEWYHDMPHVMPMMFGDVTDVHESADWYQSTYWVVIGTNLPMTRTPDAHFAPEFKYNGGKLVNLAPNYSDVTKFADLWVPVRAGTDAAFLMACIHVILREFHVERRSEYFRKYVAQYTNLPFLTMLEPDGAGGYHQGRFLRASDMEGYQEEENGQWKLLMLDQADGSLRMPPGTIGFRWEQQKTGRWNLKHEDANTGQAFDPVLTLMDTEHEQAPVAFANFTHTFDTALGTTDGKGRKATTTTRNVPIRRITLANGSEAVVTTAYDLLMAQMGVGRGLEGEYPADYDDATQPYTPAWQEQETGVGRELVLRVAREWAENAEKTEGKSLFISGSGSLHWFHGGSLTQRAQAVMAVLTGCMGVNGGGFGNYTGTEEIRPMAATETLGAAADWTHPPRLMNSTSYFYFHTDQWRYDGMVLDPLWAPWAETMPKRGRGSADQNVAAIDNGWLPFYPQFDKRSPADVLREAREAGADTEEKISQWVAGQFKQGKLRSAVHDVDAAQNHPKVMWVWRGNLIGTSMRGHEYCLRHLLGTHNNVLGKDRAEENVQEVDWHEQAPLGKLDLLINANLRMDSSANYADIVLPTAHWYEKYDLTCTDLHSFLHPFTPAHDPPWEARSDWDIFKVIAEKISELARTYLPDPVEDLVLTPLISNTPDALAQPLGEVRDWRKGEVEPIPGKSFPNVRLVKRDYTKIGEMYSTLGPRVCEEHSFGAKGIMGDLSEQYEQLKQNYLVGEKDGRPSLERAEQVAETILRISPEADGEVSHKLFEQLEKRTGLNLRHLVEADRATHHSYPDLSAQPRRCLTSPHWSGIISPERTYSPWTMNVETLKPWHTLSGRMEIYYDHLAYRELGESLPTYKPPIDMVQIGDVAMAQAEPGSKLFRFLTPHGKWQIHSMFYDSWHMLNLFRGGQVIWINDDDAKQLGVVDNDWVEVYNENGITTPRVVISQTVPRDTAIMYHSAERHINVPFSPLARKRGASDLRGGNNNAPTRIMMNPANMIGGYAQFSYFINYWGTSPSERDCAVLIRKMPVSAGKKKVIYLEKDLSGLPSR